MSKDKQYCDHCADEIADNNFYVFTHSPVDFDSGWKGESAMFCVECYDTLHKAREWRKGMKELKMYASKWLAEKMNPLGIEKTEDCLDIDESVTLYSCPRADKIEKQIIDLFGYEIGIAEAGEDWTVFIIRPNDINGRTYEHWTSKELGENMDELVRKGQS
jgi:hypothetical protein